MSNCSVDCRNSVLSLEDVLARLDRIEGKLDCLVEQRTAKDYYSTAEIAKILGRSEFTVREWARLGRINAIKRLSGRGRAKEWAIAHSELQRYQSEGLLPPPDIFQRLRNVG